MSRALEAVAGDIRTVCSKCETELPSYALACPACHWLVHTDTLKRLAARADELKAGGQLSEARQAWQEALTLLPATSQQHAVITAHVAELEAQHTESQLAGQASPNGGGSSAEGSYWKRALAGVVGIGLLLAGKLKFLLIGLTKLKTFASMFAFFGVYWSMYGWMLALGLVLSIYVHEMGHVAMLRRLKIASGAPLFIPGIGALVLLKQRIHDPKTDAAVGLAGPVWGLGAGIAALAAYGVTDAKIWLAIAQLTGFINLFNLIPVWQLDGARGFHALDSGQRWLVVVALFAALLVTGQKLLIIVGAVALWRAFQKETGPGDQRTLATFLFLTFALAWLSSLRAI